MKLLLVILLFTLGAIINAHVIPVEPLSPKVQILQITHQEERDYNDSNSKANISDAFVKPGSLLQIILFQYNPTIIINYNNTSLNANKQNELRNNSVETEKPVSNRKQYIAPENDNILVTIKTYNNSKKETFRYLGTAKVEDNEMNNFTVDLNQDETNNNKTKTETSRDFVTEVEYYVPNNFNAALHQDARKLQIVKNIYKAITQGFEFTLMNSDETGSLVLADEKDDYKDRRLQLDCTNDSNIKTKFWYLEKEWSHGHGWNTSFKIVNAAYDMSLKLDLRLDNEGASLAWGAIGRSMRTERLLWYFQSAGYTANGDPLFCIFNRLREQLLAPSTCSSDIVVQVKGKTVTCSPDLAWIVKLK